MLGCQFTHTLIDRAGIGTGIVKRGNPDYNLLNVNNLRNRK